jgi:hypothetical protein
MDYPFRRLKLEYLTYDERGVGHLLDRRTPAADAARCGGERIETAQVARSLPIRRAFLGRRIDCAVDLGSRRRRRTTTSPIRPVFVRSSKRPKVRQSDAPMCMQCGVQMIRPLPPCLPELRLTSDAADPARRSHRTTHRRRRR